MAPNGAQRTHPRMGASKRLVICCDGTWQDLETNDPTNDVLTRLGGGGLGLGIDNKIQQAYLLLCLNNQPGDEIDLFGFSHGAYTVPSFGG